MKYEYLNKKYTFNNLRPELVEKKEPPIITIIKNINHKFDGESLKDIPIFDMLLVNEKRTVEKLYSKLKKTKNIINNNIKYINK